MKMSEQVWFNGTLTTPDRASPSVASNTLHLGVAVFDGIMAYANSDGWYCHLLHEHLDRFLTGAERMDLHLQWAIDQLAGGIEQLLQTVAYRTHYLRPIAYRTAAEVFFDVDEESSSACIFAVPVSRDVDVPYRCQLSPIQRVRHEAIPASWKISGAYANSYLAERTAREMGYDTGIMLNAAGFVCEASSSNLFFIENDRLVTPRVDADLFPGLTRRLLMRQARCRGVEVIERDIRVEELQTFDGAFLCGTLSEVRAINCIGSWEYSSSTHPLFVDVVSDFRRTTHGVSYEHRLV
jgi:branched-chain amino acid aminotransferase